MASARAQPGYAALLVASGGFFFSIMSLCAKLAGKHAIISTFTILATRSIVGLVLNVFATIGSLASARRRSEPVSCGCPSRKRSWKWLSVRCLGGFGCIILEFAAISHLPLGISTMIVYSSPAWIVIWAAVLMGDPIHTSVLVCLCVCFTGLVLIVQPWRSSVDGSPLWAYALSFAASSFAGLVYVSLRELKDVSYHAVLNVFQASCLILSVAAGLLLNSLPIPPLDSLAWKYLIGVAFAAYAAEVCVTLGYARAGPSLGQISMLKFLSPMFAGMWGILIFGDTQSALQMTGSSLVLGASAMILYQQAMSKQSGSANSCSSSVQMPSRPAV